MKKLCGQGLLISEQDKKALDHFLLEKPKEWAQKALDGMISKAITSIKKDWLEKYKATQVGSISADLSVLIPAIIAMEGFQPYLNEANNKNKAQRKTDKTLEIWANGFDIEDYEELALKAFYIDPEQVLYDLMENKIANRKETMSKEYDTICLNDVSITEIPVHVDDAINSFISMPTYKNRVQSET